MHLTEIGSKMKKEIHLCDDCAREHEASLPHTVGSVPSHSAPGSPEADIVGPASDEEPTGVCKECGISFAEFRSTGRVGCPEDYVFFRKGLNPILERIHGSIRHRGKVPPQAGEKSVRQRELMKLSDELERAVREEKYEVAAKIRDQLHELREEIDSDAD